MSSSGPLSFCEHISDAILQDVDARLFVDDEGRAVFNSFTAQLLNLAIHACESTTVPCEGHHQSSE